MYIIRVTAVAFTVLFMCACHTSHGPVSLANTPSGETNQNDLETISVEVPFANVNRYPVYILESKVDGSLFPCRVRWESHGSHGVTEVETLISGPPPYNEANVVKIEPQQIRLVRTKCYAMRPGYRLSIELCYSATPDSLFDPDADLPKVRISRTYMSLGGTPSRNER